jgi:hypothetical protein
MTPEAAPNGGRASLTAFITAPLRPGGAGFAAVLGAELAVGRGHDRVADADAGHFPRSGTW